MLEEIIAHRALSPENVVFVGNETLNGTETDIRETGVKTIQINDVYECNMLLRTISG